MQRTRYRSEITPQVTTEMKHGEQVYYYPHTVVNDQTVMQDVVTPGFKSLSSQGKIINNPMESTQTIIRNESIDYNADALVEYFDRSDNQWKYYTRLDWIGVLDTDSLLNGFLGVEYLPVPAVNVQSLIDYAVTQAWANVEGSSFASIECLAELDKTILSLVAIGKRLIKVYRSLKHGHLDYPLSLLSAKELCNQYMEVRYSLRPLEYDLKSFAQNIKKKMSDIPRQTFRGHTSAREVSNDSVDWTLDQPGSAGLVTSHARVRRQSTRGVSVRAGVLADVASLSWLERWGFDNGPEAMWELVPFSFIVDWFFNVGDTIRAWTPEFSIRALASWYSVVDTSYQMMFCEDSGRTCIPNSGYRYIGDRFEIGQQVRSRTVISRYRVPNPKLSILPTFKPRFEILKFFDLLIILSQLAGR